MLRTKRFRYVIIIGIVAGMGLLFAVAGTALAAWTNLPTGSACAPTQGHFTWSQSSTVDYVSWYQHEKWTGTQFTCINTTVGNWHQLEVEAYNPGASSSCDKLHTTHTDYTLPLRSSPSIANGCGSSTYKEETKFYISHSGIGNGTNYWTYTEYLKYNAAAGNHEVNWSFANYISDWNLAKIGYTISMTAPYASYTPYCSNPSGILSSTGC